MLGCLAVLVTHGSTVLIYFIEKDLWGRPFPGAQEKYLGIAERLVLALCFFCPTRGGPRRRGLGFLHVLDPRQARGRFFLVQPGGRLGPLSMICGGRALGIQ